MGVDPNADTKRKSHKILVNFIANTEIRNDTTRVRSAVSDMEALGKRASVVLRMRS